MSPAVHDYLILGQGLAGSLLAWHLIHAGKRVLVIDDGLRSSSSKVAAGLINPLAGMRFNCAPRTAEWLDSAHAFYNRLGEMHGRRYFHAIEMQRLFRSPQQRRFYERQLERPQSQPYLGGELTGEDVDPGVDAPHGGFAQTQTGYLEMPPILADLRDWLDEHNAYRQQSIDYAAVQPGQDSVVIGELEARHLVFCEGYRLQANPWFSALPLQPDKGEFLQLDSKRQLCQHIINGAHMLIPLAEGGYRFGATHEHQQIDNEPSKQARERLLEGLNGLLKDTQDIEISAQSAGVRPATSDRSPFIGVHPMQPRLWVFNGFGARGALSIPWYAERFSAHLLGSAPIPGEADIQRFRELF